MKAPGLKPEAAVGEGLDTRAGYGTVCGIGNDDVGCFDQIATCTVVPKPTSCDTTCEAVVFPSITTVDSRMLQHAETQMRGGFSAHLYHW